MTHTAATTFADALDHAADRSPHKVAVVDDTGRATYAALRSRVERVAGRLHEQGVGPGEVVTSQLRNCIDAVVLCLAVNRLGAVHNPVVTIYRERELSFIREQARSTVVIDRADHEVLSAAGPPPRVTASPDGPDLPESASFLVYTSGSTSQPKGVRHSDRTLTAECAAQAAYHELTAAEVFVMAASVGHVSGLVYGVLLPIWLGATTVLMDTWDPERFLFLVESERGTFSGGAPTFLQGLVDHPRLDHFDTSTLRVFPCGGADVDPALIRAASARLDVRTGRGYGSTEFPSITSAAGPGERDDKRADTDGRPIGANEVRIVDGEIHARGPELFLGYRDPALDVDAFTEDGWFRTGDLGAIDDDGYLSVTGRLKDIIIRSGEKISARELEDLIAGHPKVAAVAVIARPDARTGERACACVVPVAAGAAPTLAELGAFLTDLGISRRKLPEALEVRPTLPMTAGGKVDKQALRAEPPSSESEPERQRQSGGPSPNGPP